MSGGRAETAWPRAITHHEHRSMYMHEETAHPAIARILRGIVALVMAAALALGTASIVGCTASVGDSETSRADYAKRVDAAIAMFEKASEEFTRQQQERLAGLDPEAALSEEDLTAIDEMTGKFEAEANNALDYVLDSPVPAGLEAEAKSVRDYFEFMKETAVPAQIKSLQDLELGGKLNDYKLPKIDESLIGKATQMQGAFRSALSDLGLLDAGEESAPVVPDGTVEPTE